MFDINKILFMQEHNYDPTDETIPHLVQVCDRYNFAFDELPCTSYENALKQARLWANTHISAIEAAPLTFKIVNVSEHGKFRHISRIDSFPEHLCN